jgi:hypothetical protein
MQILGVRCSNTDYTYCLLSGDAVSPQIESIKHVAYPKGFTEAETLKWLYQEFQEICCSQSIDSVGIKRAETNVKRSNSLEMRIQAEGIVSLAASQVGCCTIERKVGSTVAKGLGLKGKAKYLKTTLDTSIIPDFNSYSDKEQDAILVAWSCME